MTKSTFDYVGNSGKGNGTLKGGMGGGGPKQFAPATGQITKSSGATGAASVKKGR